MTEPKPTQTPYAPVQTQTVALDDEPIVDLATTANFIGYLLRSMRRRRRLLLTATLSTLALVVALVLVMPRSYRIEMRILTHKSGVMSALVLSSSALPQSADNPTAGAVELIKSRDNLANLLQDVRLPELWAQHRSPVARFKDSLLERAFGKASEDDTREMYLKMLDEKVSAEVEGDVVLINVEWPDAQVALTLAEAVQARYLNMRHKMELSEIQEPVNILSRSVETSRVGIGEVVKRMQKVFEQRETDLQVKAGTPRAEVHHRTTKKSRFISIRKPTGSDVGPGSGDLRRQLGEKEAALNAAKRGFGDRLKRAQDELSTLLASLGPDHPDVVEAKRNLEAIAKEPTELGTLEAEHASLATQVRNMPLPPDDAVAPAPAPEPQASDYDLMRVPVSEDLYKEMDKDPEIAAVLDDLKKRQDEHDTLVSRLVNAKLQSETANVAFEYRYITTAPPILPRKPVKPNVPVMLGGGAVGAIALGIMLALLADLFSGRILETWQVTRFLKLRPLGEIEEP